MYLGYEAAENWLILNWGCLLCLFVECQQHPGRYLRNAGPAPAFQRVETLVALSGQTPNLPPMQMTPAPCTETQYGVWLSCACRASLGFAAGSVLQYSGRPDPVHLVQAWRVRWGVTPGPRHRGKGSMGWGWFQKVKPWAFSNPALFKSLRSYPSIPKTLEVLNFVNFLETPAKRKKLLLLFGWVKSPPPPFPILKHFLPPQKPSLKSLNRIEEELSGAAFIPFFAFSSWLSVCLDFRLSQTPCSTLL